jgi:hypothetical protein
MRRTVAVIIVLAFFVVFPLGANATAKLSRGEAKAASIGALQRYYGETWRYSSDKEVGQGERISRTRWALAYQFDYEPGQACYGEVIAWRGRYGRIFTDVRPNFELGYPCS